MAVFVVVLQVVVDNVYLRGVDNQFVIGAN